MHGTMPPNGAGCSARCVGTAGEAKDMALSKRGQGAATCQSVERHRSLLRVTAPRASQPQRPRQLSPSAGCVSSEQQMLRKGTRFVP